MVKVIAFDADDTLWENESFYTNAKAQFTQLLGRYQDTKIIEQRLNEVEIYNIRYYGYGIKSFILSMIETAIELSNDQVKGGELLEIINLAKKVLTAEVTLFDHVEETLFKLAKDYDLMLITKGEQWEQERKLKNSGMAQYFRFVEIVGEKTEATYRNILDKYGISPPEFLMVGNSIKSDITPVLKIGGRAALIPYANTWFHEMESGEDLKPGAYGEIEHIGLLPEYLSRLASPLKP